MKLNRKKLKGTVKAGPPVTYADVKKADWMIADPNEQKAALAENRVLSGGDRPPEVWLQDGEEKKLRFRDQTPILIWRYSVRIGKQWRQFTKPGPDEIDLFDSELGLRPSLKAVYEVIDKKGYVDKNGKRLRNLARFFVANTRLYEILKNFGNKRGPITEYDIEISRTGTRRNTVYSAIPDPLLNQGC